MASRLLWASSRVASRLRISVSQRSFSSVYVELPDVGRSVSQGESFGAVESVKATSDINSPISGKVLQVNNDLTESPALVNSSPYEEGWIIKVELTDAGEVEKLMDSDKYSKFCQEEDAKH
ncbi:unnamed protein product [Microthlaspi erraticum]|uniref:Lipoyl-binding domain-containing protein n=1 Tax=Microthlaspi erraticum TaxID=1685480 RepID=A0A6D2L5J8_9BRAS|nr:unnamed protein product [Microthlaspi erraticum]